MSITNRRPTHSLATLSAQNGEATKDVDIRATFSIDYSSDSSLSDPPDSDDLHSPTDSNASDRTNSSLSSSTSSSSDGSPTIAIPSIRAHAISRELSLTCAQATQLHDLMQSDMRARSLLGEMSFLPSVKRATWRVLKPTIAKVRAELPFLDEQARKGVGEARLVELLMARAKILNANEKHNRYMVRKGKVAKRKVGSGGREEGVDGYLGGGVDRAESAGREEQASIITGESRLGVQNTAVPRVSAHEDRHDDAQDAVQAQAERAHERLEDNAETFTRTSTPNSRVPNGTVREVDDNAQPNPHPMQANLPVANQSNAPTSVVPLQPTALFVRHITSPYAAAILSTPGLTLAHFTALVSAQLGFDATGRISAVVSISYRVAPVSSLVRIDSEETWRAVVEIWRVMGRRIGDGIVE